MGALTRLILALLLGGCAAMIYFGDHEAAQIDALRAPFGGTDRSIHISRLAKPDETTPLTMLYVTASNAALRAGPSGSAHVVETLEAGMPAVVIKDAGGGWLHILASEIGKQGYIAESVLSITAPSEG